MWPSENNLLTCIVQNKIPLIHWSCQYIPFHPLKNHANHSLGIGELGEWWKRGKPHTGSLTLAFRPAFSVVRGGNPLRQVLFSRVNQFEVILKGVASGGKANWLGVGGWTRTVGRGNRGSVLTGSLLDAAILGDQEQGPNSPCEDWR